MHVYEKLESLYGCPTDEDMWHVYKYVTGKDLDFIRALAKVKVKESVEIGGFYAKHWPRYLEEKMGADTERFEVRLRKSFEVYEEETKDLYP